MYLKEDKRCSGYEAAYVARKQGNDIVVELNVAGYPKENLSIETSKDVVKVFGKSSDSAGDGVWTPGFYNRFPVKEQGILLKGDEATEVSAEITNGILKITLGVAEEFRSTAVEIA